MIHCYVNVYKRIDLAVQTVKSLRENASENFPITVIDDGGGCDTTELAIHADQVITWPHKGQGEARRAAMELFLDETDPGESDCYGLFVDGDMTFSKHYDAFCYECVASHALRPFFWVSPYRSAKHVKSDRQWEFETVLGHAFGGATLYGHRKLVKRSLELMPEEWSHAYDWDLVTISCGCFKPIQSLANHAGVMVPGSLHMDPEEVAYGLPPVGA